jgi:hypothetical protein
MQMNADVIRFGPNGLEPTPEHSYDNDERAEIALDSNGFPGRSLSYL